MFNSIFSYMTPLLKTGYKRPLSEEDLYDPTKYERVENLTNNLEMYTIQVKVEIPDRLEINIFFLSDLINQVQL